MMLVKNNKIVFYRTKNIIYIFITSFCIIVLCIIYLQYIQFNYFFDRSVKNYTRKKRIDSLRGNIYDCNMKELAVTRPILRLLWNKIPYKLTEKDIELLNFLENVAGLIFEKEKLQEKDGNDTYVLSKKLTFQQLSILEENIGNHPRLSIEIHTERAYPYESLAAHAIGYINALKKEGETGLEKIFDINLQGEPGIEKRIVNARGTVMHSELELNAQRGQDIITTLDIDIQTILESIIPYDEKAAVIVMHAQTGALRGLLSSPRFTPSQFASKITTDELMELQKNGAFINRCFTGAYPPGSIFKLVSTIALLEEKIIDVDSQWFCSGKCVFGDRTFHCNRKTGHGKINIFTGLSFSCNIPFFTEALKNNLTIDLLHKYATLLGLGSATHAPFYESKGLVPSRAWKRKCFNEPWYTGETLSVAIGQGALQSTPIQIACLLAGVMTGNHVTPHILLQNEIIKRPFPVSPNTLKILRDSMKLGVREGTSQALQYLLSQWELYAKTGSSQLYSKTKQQQDDNDRPEDNKLLAHGLIALYAKHALSEPLIIVIVVENCDTSRVATQYAKKFLIQYTKLLKKQTTI